MKLSGWQRLWLVFSIIILLIVASFTFLLFPKKSEITSRWAYETIEAIKKPAEYSYQIRDSYKDYSDEELIKKIHEKYKEKNPFTKIIFDEIDKKYKNELGNLSKNQIKHILIGLAVYCCLIIFIYIFGWSIGWIYRGFRAK